VDLGQRGAQRISAVAVDRHRAGVVGRGSSRLHLASGPWRTAQYRPRFDTHTCHPLNWRSICRASASLHANTGDRLSRGLMRRHRLAAGSIVPPQIHNARAIINR